MFDHVNKRCINAGVMFEFIALSLSLSLSLSLTHTHTHTHILCMYTVKYKYGEIYLHSLRLLNLSIKVIKVNNIGLELCLFISNNIAYCIPDDANA